MCRESQRGHRSASSPVCLPQGASMGRELILSMHVNSTTWKAEKDEREVVSKVKRDRGLHSLRASVSAQGGNAVVRVT